MHLDAIAVPVCLLCLLGATPPAPADDPFADAIVSFNAGIDPDPAYPNPLTVLGSPERYTGEGIFPAVVSVFSPPYGTDEIVSIGKGGALVVQFDTPVTDDPRNPFGIDLILFGNTGFIDQSWPDGIVGGGLFGADGGTVEVSDDGVTWVLVPAVEPDGLFPTTGYLDTGPYDGTPGMVWTIFTRPVDPSLTLADFVGLTHDQVRGLYQRSGGGAGVDLAPLGLGQVRFVRISNPADALEHIELDALADVTPLGDVNLDQEVDVLDLLALVSAWGDAGPFGSDADFDGDGSVDVADLLVLLGNWSS